MPRMLTPAAAAWLLSTLALTGPAPMAAPAASPTTAPVPTKPATTAPPAPATPDALLRSLAGTWNATMQIAAPDDAPPEIINALEVNRLGGDGAWIVSQFRSQMDGRPFEGHGVLAFDPESGKFRRVWVDVTAPTPWRSEGTWDAAGRTLTMWIETFDSNGHPVRWREETVIKDDQSRTFTMYAPGPEKTEAAAITITYKRRPEGAPPQPYRPAATPPGPEHARLGRDAGTWNARLETAKGSPIDPKISKATEVNALCCDGLFLISDIEGAAKKAHFAGHGVIGYDPAAKRYWSAWVDTNDRSLGVFQGDWDEATATYTFPLAEPGAAGGAAATAGPGPTRETIATRPDGQRTLTLWARGADGKEFAGVTIEYQRAKEKSVPAHPSAADR